MVQVHRPVHLCCLCGHLASGVSCSVPSAHNTSASSAEEARRGEGVAAIQNHLKLAALTFLESTDESRVGWQSGAPSKHDGKEEPQRANKIP